MKELTVEALKEKLKTDYAHILNGQNDLTIEDIVAQIVNYYEETINRMPGNVYLFDKDLKPITCNQNVLNMLNYKSPAEFKAKSFEEMGHDAGWSKSAEQSFVKDSLEVIRTKKAKLGVQEPPIPGPDGMMIYFLSSRVPIFNQHSEVTGILGISVDITELKKMSISLQKALHAAEEANYAKTEFIRNMSHDIRTPLSGIIGMSQLIQSKSNDSTIKSYASDIHDAGNGLLTLLNEIIETAQLDSHDLTNKKTCFNVKETIASLSKVYTPAIKEKGLKFETYCDDNIPDLLYGHEILIHRIMLNLLGNAIKFTEKGCISIEASFIRKTSERVYLKVVVSDTGIGIDKDKHEAIFEKFSRLNASYSNKYAGTGLGLYVVKEFIKKIGGDIQVQSQKGKGSRFICSLQFKIPTPAQMRRHQLKKDEGKTTTQSPHSNPPALGRSATQAPIIPSDHAKVLLVEDTLIPRKIATTLLTEAGYQVTTAETVAEALTASQQQRFDFIFMDLGLPDGSGLDVTKAIRRDMANPNQHTLIAALTAHADPTIKQECIKSGMQVALDKPLSPTHIQKMETWIQNTDRGSPPTLDPQPLPLIDLDISIQAVGGNKAMAFEFFDMLIDSLDEFQHNIVNAYEAENWEMLKHHVHKLHGGLCYVGAVRLKFITRALETEIIKNSGNYQILYQQLINTIQDTKLAYDKVKNPLSNDE